MKFLPPAAAAQLTQKSSKAVDNAAAVAEVRDLKANTVQQQSKRHPACVVQAAAEAVVSAQDLVLSCKDALKKAESTCSSLIGIFDNHEIHSSANLPPCRACTCWGMQARKRQLMKSY